MPPPARRRSLLGDGAFYTPAAPHFGRSILGAGPPQGNCCSGLYCVGDQFSGSEATRWVCASEPGLPTITDVQNGWAGGVNGTNATITFSFYETDTGAGSVRE